MKIVFSDGTGPKQTLYYFSTDLADGSFERSFFSAFLAKFGPADSLIKSASYLLHKLQFSGVRKLLLDRSAIIVQDDSGIPLGYFGKRWRLLAFGHYAGPISMFAGFYQTQMAGLFQGANPIEFGIGYRWRSTIRTFFSLKSSHHQWRQELSPRDRRSGTLRKQLYALLKSSGSTSKPQPGRLVVERRGFSRSVGRSNKQ